MSYQQLIQDHDGIDRLARRLERIIDSVAPDKSEALLLLGQLAIAVSEHLADEDRSIYSCLIDRKKSRPAVSEIDFEAAFQQLRADWMSYLADWHTETLESDWPQFVEETKSMISRLRSRVRDETDLIYPLAMQQGLIRLLTHRSA